MTNRAADIHKMSAASFFVGRNCFWALALCGVRGLTVREVPGDWGMSPNKQALLYKRALLAGLLLFDFINTYDYDRI